MAKKKNDEITEAQKRFVDTYINFGCNGRLAYKSLHPDVTNESAEVLASKILSNIKVKDYLEMKQAQIRMREEVKLDFLIGELQRIVLQSEVEEIERDSQGQIIKTKSKTNNPSKIQAMALLAKLGGHEATKKIDMKIDGNINLKDMLGFDNDEE